MWARHTKRLKSNVVQSILTSVCQIPRGGQANPKVGVYDRDLRVLKDQELKYQLQYDNQIVKGTTKNKISTQLRVKMQILTTDSHSSDMTRKKV